LNTDHLPKTLWEFRPLPSGIVNRLSAALDIPQFVSEIMAQRGFTDPEPASEFLNPSLDQLYDPFLLNDMERAVDRICQAFRNRENILICGDYDVDGIASVTLLKRCLPGLGSEIFTYLPNRFKDGYGFHPHVADYANQIGATLIITVDCGTTANDAVNRANQLNIDIIITDHHEPCGPLPSAHSIINPKREDSNYPDTNLAGVGVAFKLIQALIKKNILRLPILPLLEFVALGTIADVVNLVGENRIFVHFGLESLAHTTQIGLKALMKVAGITHGRKVNPVAIGFQLAPRINAVGRMGKPNQALNLLLTQSEQEAEFLANTLNNLNQQRQQIEEKIMQSAYSQISQMDLEDELIFVISGENWHEGVIGIVASKISERYYRPTCIISVSDGIGKGSGRSIPCFNLFECLKEVDQYLIEFGGHKIAAGFRIHEHQIDAFREACNKHAQSKLDKCDLIPVTYLDSEISLTDLCFSSIKSLERLAPFGLGNPKPKFLIRNLKNKYPPRQVGIDGNHLNLIPSQDQNSINAIAFNFGKNVDEIRSCNSYDIIATPEINIWNERERVQLNIHDIQPH